MRAILLSLLLTTAMTAEDPARAADHEVLRGVLAELTVALSAHAVADIVRHLDSEFS